jgi:hypothetical protein
MFWGLGGQRVGEGRVKGGWKEGSEGAERVSKG